MTTLDPATARSVLSGSPHQVQTSIADVKHDIALARACGFARMHGQILRAASSYVWRRV